MLSSLSNSVFKPQHFQCRQFWRWLNIIFNRPDMDRIQKVGPNKACSEWLVKNGAGISWLGEGEVIKNYDQISRKNNGSIERVFAEDSSISHDGFLHFAGCKHIRQVTFDKCEYIGDRAMEELKYLSESPVEQLSIIACNSVTDHGLRSIPLSFPHLKTLVVDRLAGVDKILQCANDLQKKFPNTRLNINGKDWENNTDKQGKNG